MRVCRRRVLGWAAGAAALPALARIARADAYPTRPVRMVVGFPASNASDIVARLAAQKLSERLGQSFVVENRPGAGGNIGVEFVVNAAPDGYTLLAASTSAAINATLYDKLNSISCAISRRSRASRMRLTSLWSRHRFRRIPFRN